MCLPVDRVIDEMQIQNHLTKRQVDSLLHFEVSTAIYRKWSRYLENRDFVKHVIINL